MAAAPLGDDVFGDDPTVNELEARAAALLGKEAGLFVSSGTQGNLVSLLAHLPRGHEAIAGETTHTVMDEAGGHAVVAGATIRAAPRARRTGRWTRRRSPRAWRDPDDLHEPITGLVVLENTHAHSGGRPLPARLRPDGRRDRPRARRAAAHGRRAVLQRRRRPGRRRPRGRGARRQRHVLPVQGPRRRRSGRSSSGRRRSSRARGGRASCWAAACARSGSSAAAGLVALGDGPDGTIARLAEDHANARRLAEGLARLDGVRSPGGIAQPGDGAARPDARRDQLRPVPRGPRPRRRSSPPSRRAGVLLVPYANGSDPRRDPPRDHRPPTSTASSTTAARRPARHRARARPASRPTTAA